MNKFLIFRSIRVFRYMFFASIIAGCATQSTIQSTSQLTKTEYICGEVDEYTVMQTLDVVRYFMFSSEKEQLFLDNHLRIGNKSSKNDYDTRDAALLYSAFIANRILTLMENLKEKAVGFAAEKNYSQLKFLRSGLLYKSSEYKETQECDKKVDMTDTVINFINQLPNYKLINAVLQEDYDQTKTAINNGADVNYYEELLDMSIIKYAVAHGYLSAMDRYAQIKDSNSKHGVTPLMLAAMLGNVEILRYLMGQGANLNASSAAGRNALHYSAVTQSKPVLNILISKGIDINSRDYFGNTALNIALAQSPVDREYILGLIENRIDVNLPSHDGTTPLIAAIQHNEFEIAKILIQFGAATYKLDTNGNNALYYLRNRTGPDIKELTDLIKAGGANGNSKPRDIDKTMHTYLYRDKFSELQELVEAGNVDVNARSTLGQPMFWDATEQFLITKYLIEKGADIFAIQKTNNIKFKERLSYNESWSLLHIAARNNNYRLIKYLFKKGLDVNIPGALGMTPLAVAIEYENLDAIEALIECGANVNARFDKKPLIDLANQKGGRVYEVFQSALEAMR